MPQVVAGVKAVIPQFFAFGHRFKTSYKILTDAEITAHLSAAEKNKAMPMATCLQTPSPTLKGMFPCCRTPLAQSAGTGMFGGFPIRKSDGVITKFTDLKAWIYRENQVEPKIQAVLKPFGLGDTKANRESVLKQLDTETKKSHESKYNRQG